MDAADSISQLSLILQWRFQGHQSLFFADDFWSVGTQFSLTIPRVNDDSIFSIDFIRQPWISMRCRFHRSAVTQFSKIISCSTVTQFSLTTYGSALGYGGWRFHASNMTLFLLSVLCVAREFFDAVDSIRQLSLILQWRFKGHQSLFFRWRFLVGGDAVFTDDSTRQRWLCFLYWFHSSTVN
jgi:aryl carrier-like protein